MNPNDSAFPTELSPIHAGLTKREYLAAMAMQGIIAKHPRYSTTEIPGATKVSPEESCALLRHFANGAIAMADSLIAALSKEPTP